MSKNLVKGTILIDFVRLIRANQNLPWDKYLTPEDINFMKTRIMPSSWYPMEIYERMGYATFMLIGKGDLKNSRAFGAFSTQETFYNVYKNILFKEGESPISMLKRFVVLRKQFSKHEDSSLEVMILEELENNKVVMKVAAPENGKFLEPYAYHLSGMLEKLLEIAGAQNPKAEILKMESEKEREIIIELSWDAA